MWKLGPAISVLENCLSHLVFLSSTSILSIVWCGTLCPCGHVLSGNVLSGHVLSGNGERTIKVKD